MCVYAYICMCVYIYMDIWLLCTDFKLEEASTLHCFVAVEPKFQNPINPMRLDSAPKVQQDRGPSVGRKTDVCRCGRVAG